MSFAAAGHARLVAALLFGVVCAVWVGSARAATLHVDASGTLTGASDVVVNGHAYDVAFVEGSCASLYFPCLFESAFAFSTAADAEAAAQALLDQVFLDVAAGPFDTQPALTNGCSEPNSCSAFVPYGLFVEEHAVTVFTRTAHNSSEAPGNFLDVTGGNTFDANFNTTNRAESVWAVFTGRQLFAVPEASSAILLLTGSVALFGVRRRARRRDPGTTASTRRRPMR